MRGYALQTKAFSSDLLNCNEYEVAWSRLRILLMICCGDVPVVPYISFLSSQIELLEVEFDALPIDPSPPGLDPW